MAVINYATKEILCKIVYYGPAMCGKTTNLQRIHAMVGKENRGDLVSLATEQDRTLFFDFLPLDLGDIHGLRTKFQLYTVPGQVYYNATRRLVLRGADALVFVVDSARERMQDNIESLKNLRENLAALDVDPEELPWVVQYNKRDLPDAVPVDELNRRLGLGETPGIEAVASEGQGVKETLKRISSRVISRLREEESEPIVPQKAAETAPGEEMHAPMEEEQAPPPLAIRQKSAIYWAGIRVGTSTLNARSRLNTDGYGQYQLTEASRYLLLFNRISVRMLDSAGMQERPVDGRRTAGHAFHVRGESNGHSPPPADLWISRNSDIFLRVQGRFGEISFVPSTFSGTGLG